MRTDTLRVDLDEGYWDAIRKAVSVLNAGGLVAFPTETVYGLAANAALPEAIKRLREVKNRPDEKPFTVHIGRPGDLERYVPSPSLLGRRLARKGWPGPLTLIFSLADVAAAPVMKQLPTGQERSLYHEGTIGLRCPDDKPACDLLTTESAPVVAASANPAGAPPAVTGKQAFDYLNGRIDLVLDGGRARYARPSTIVRVNEQSFDVLREGVLDRRLIDRLATAGLLFVCSGNTCRSPIAEGLCRKVLAERLNCRPEELVRRGYVVGSAGTHGLGKSGPTPEAVQACAALGVDISGHRAQPLTPELINTADYVFGMTSHHVESISEMMPAARARVSRLDPDADVEDPIGGDAGLYMDLADRIEKLIRRRLEGIEI
jgi:tRNA threonylcarbamoyl adenosine modification protein (Sua5/YciO/YrdC/YwlC family)